MRVSKVNIITNDKNLIDTPSEETQKQLNRDREQQYNNYNYAIDLNTGDVKNNNMLYVFLNTLYNVPSGNTKNDITQDLYNTYIANMQDYLKTLRAFKGKKYKTDTTLNKDIIKFNKLFDANYYNGFNLRVKDLLNDNVRNNYINAYATAIATIQRENINNIGIDNFIKLDLDDAFKKYDNTDATKNVINFYVGLSDMKQLQQEFKKHIDKNDFYNDLVIHKFIFELTIKQTTDNIQDEINNYKEHYTIIHNLYNAINKDIKQIVDNFKIYQDKLNDYALITAPQIQQPQLKKIPLLAPIIFNDTYLNDTFKTIYKNSILKLQIKLNLDVKISDFRENIIFYDNLTNKRIDLVPLDYAIFIACAELNANNKSLSGIRGNIPISIDNIVQFIADNDKLYNTKIRQKKLYDFIKDRLLLYKSCIVDAIYTKDGKTKKLYNDPMPILDNTQFNDPLNEGVDLYIIKSSAILTIIAKLEFIEGKPFLASYTSAKEYINDGQNNTTEILNIKYYILPKLLQQSNRKSKNKGYYPTISLNDMYKSLALLKGKETLTRQEQKRARDTAFIFMDHLKTKGLLKEYDTKPLENSKLNNKPIKAQKIDNIYTRVNANH